MTTFIGVIVLALLTTEQVTADSDWEYDDNYQEFSAGKDERGLFPNIFNLATHAEIRATSTCGQHGPEHYCKLVEHVFMRQPQCDICDANNHYKNHPIDYAIDGTKRWWQSPSLSNGLGYEKINITIDLRQEYQVAYVVIKAGISPRPGTWVLEKSLDGETFTPWQFYAVSESDCMRVFGVPASTGVPRFTRDDEVLCTTYFSRLDPLEWGEIHTSLVNGRPGAEHPTIELQNFTRTRFVRLRMLSLRTLNADLMVINRRDGKLDHSVTRRYFYTISDISIGGQCICYGHAERCPPEETHGQFRCECRHNTYGESCNKCLPLFNQLPWRHGTHAQPNICQACQCFNHADLCEYDEEIERQRLSVTPEGIYEGGGKCIDCKHNTAGINCEKCLPEFYRPSNVSHYRQDACRPCDCDPLGSENTECIRDDTTAYDGLRPGDCICKPGFGGRRCDRCAPGYRNHPVCEPCPCNQAGSLNFDTCEESECVCKLNVEGKFCDRCKPGTIYLDKENPLGCQSCFCFGKSSDCHERRWQTGQITAHSGWNLTDINGQVAVEPKLNSTELLIFNSDDYPEAQSLYYWTASKKFLGNLLGSYGANLRYYVYYVPAETGGHPTPVADLVIEGNGIKVEYHSRINFFPKENVSTVVPLRVTDGWYNSQSRRPVDKSDLMRALADVTSFRVRAKYHQTQLQSSIYGLTLETAVSAEETEAENEIGDGTTPGVGRIHAVEVCSCPENFVGNSCESCVTGFRRVGNQLYDGRCEACNCQGHSTECDPYTGHCLNCLHNTTGPRCEQCLPGFYGNPSLGGELGACQPCACPTTERSRSATCALSQLVFESVAAAEQDEYVCTACEVGYDGNKCEVCADGYFGDPLAVNGTCEPCSCNGNIDSMAIGNCDSVTGECLRCIGHTTGEHCERCEDNHWGSALEHTCRACNCHRRGSVSLQCHNDTGRCDCNENYTGAHCDRCLAGHGGIEDGCPKCACNATGSLGTSCDEISGQCSCKKGVFGKNCDMCITSYFGFGYHGCEYCHCNEFGAIEGKECHNITGECQCRPRVEGTRCESCEPGFFNLTSGQGCQPCECNEVGSVGNECNVDSGQCVCKPGVTGLKCDKCAPNYYGLDEEGCKQCQRCPAPGHVCDAITGECVCPPNTVGDMCEACTPNAWSYHPLKGCELCDCSGIGADSSQCNSRTGQCKCKSGYVGHKCDHCEPGFFNFPDCEPCNCEVSGTDPLTCKGDTCICENNGQCKCKKHVTGDKCDQCAVNSFSMETQNPLGCTECFCFNRTAECEQSDLFWKQIYTADRTVTFETPFEYFTKRHNIHILREEPQNYNSYLTNHAPLYWPLPRSFLGDRTGSYNGFIRFRISNDDNYRKFSNVLPEPSRFRVFPQVVLVGNHRIELEHVPVDVAHDGKYKVRLHETQWRNRISPQLPVSRKQFMVALQNVQAIYIRGTYSDMYRGDSIALREVSLDVAAGAAEVGSSGSAAIGVEQCVTCPEGYIGSSCQNPAEGYCRKRIHDYLNNPDDLTLIGYASPCDCHGHSTVCDSETCRCTDCAHNTVGDFCELCRPGYYGNAREGHADSCHKCACPLATNSFSDTCTVSETGRGYVCDACKPGYTGPYCESCIPGYFGNPTVEGGFCDLCACHPYGSLHGICNNVTGSCECREGVEGRDCSLCRPRHAFINRVCTSCDQGCYKDLMVFEDEMEEQLSSIENVHDIKPIPRKRLERIENTRQSFDELLNNVKSSNTEAQSLVSDLGTENRHTKLANIVDQEFKLITERTNDSLTRIKELEATLAKIRDAYWSQNRKVVETSRHLGDFTNRVGSRHSQGQVDSLVLQAERYLEALRERNEALEKKYNYARKNADDAEQLLRAILAKKINDTSYDELFTTTQAHREMIKAFRDTIWDVARENTIKARDLTTTTKARIASLERLIAQIGQYETDAKEQLEQAEKNVEDIRAHVLNIQDDYKEVDDRVLPELRELREQLVEDHINYYRDTLHDYHNNYVRKAEQHAKDLEHLAHRLKSRFSAAHSMSTDALAASTAYHEIAEALRNASVAAKKAKQNAEDAFSVVDPSSETSLVTEAGLALNKSLALKQLALDSRENKYEAQADELHKSLDKIKLQSEDIEKNITWIKDVHQLLDDHHDRINTVYSTADDSAEVVATIGSSTKDLFDEVDALKKQADSVTNFNEKAILDDIANVTKASDDIERIKRIVEDVRERSKRQNEQIAEIRHDMSVLKEKIKEAREKASKVKVGVKSEVGSACVREYLSPLSLSPTNTIALKYRPALESPDSMIFLTTTKGTRTQGREYIAVELKSKKIHVHWDIGAGRRDAAVIKRNLVYIPLSDRFTWYQIEINRIGNTMKITLTQRRVLSSEGTRDVDEPIHVTVGEPDVTNNVVFNTEPGHTRVYVGHSDASLTDELGLATNQFHGTLGEMVLDGSSVPLWAFDSTSGNCDGAVGPPSPRVTGHMLRNGFAQVRLPMNERANTMITVTFSAYSPNGLLYFRGSRSTGNFVAIELQEGSVVVKMHFGGESHVEVRSGKDTYADGHVYKVRTIRSHDEVHLQIDPEDRVSTVVPGQSPVLNIDEADHYVGGVPPDYNTTAFASHNIKFLGFFGCIQSVRPNQVSELDLDHPVRSQRMEPGCEFREERLAPADRVIGFTQPGYLVTKGIRLSTDSTLSFNVRTKNSNALLLYQSGKVHKRTIRDTSGDDFIAVVIYGGRIIVQLGTSDQRMKRPSLSSNNSYNDGLLHSIFLSRIGSDIQVRIDDREVLAATLDDERTIGTEDASLIFGGFPEKYRFENQNNDLSTTEPLIGCLTDVYHNYEKLPLIPEEHQANMGSCQFDDLVAPEAEEPLTEEEQRQFDRKNSRISLMLAAPTLSSSHLDPSLDTSWQTCEAIGSGYSNDTVREHGVRFGVSESSHARVNFAKPYPDYSNFTVSFSFRTRQKKSMLWIWANYKNYTRYFYLNVEGGFLTLEAKGHKEPKTLQFKGKRVDDNEWHTVVLTKRNREASVQVDDLEAEIMKDAPNPKVMRKRMYVGGVISKHRKQFDLPLPGFSGCIRNFQVDGAVQDLLAASRDVLPCARNRNVAYVHGGGYALFGPLREYKGDDGAKPSEIGFSFRSTHPENALLMAMLYATEDAYQDARFVVRLRNNSLVISAHFSKHRLTFEHALKMSACPQQWHHFSIVIGAEMLSVTVDGNKHEFPVEISRAAMDEIHSLPIHVGGTTAPVSVTLEAKSLAGCVKNLQLSGVLVPFSKAKKTHKVLQNGCPFS